jgi:hypothetical protein
MSTRRLREIITQLRAIPHVRIIRIGSKIPAFNPFRILDDPALQDLLRTCSTPEKLCKPGLLVALAGWIIPGHERAHRGGGPKMLTAS